MLRKLVYAGLAALTLGAASLATTTPAEAYWHRGFGLSFGFGSPFFGSPFYGPGYGYGYGYRPYYGYYAPRRVFRSYGAYPACSYRRVRIATHYGWRWRTRRVCW